MSVKSLQVVRPTSSRAGSPPALGPLRRQIRALERARAAGGAAGGAAGQRTLSLGAAEVDRALPEGGLALGALHEVAGRHGDGAACGFLSALIARLSAQSDGALLWCRRRDAHIETGALHAPGLAAFGLDPARLILLSVKRDKDVLWAMREGLACPRLAAVVGEVGAVGAVDLTASRRLQLAAEASGVSGFLLREPEALGAPSAAVSRWHIRPAPSGPVPDFEVEQSRGLARGFGPGRPRWQIELMRCRGTVPSAWCVEWCHETGDFSVAAPLSDRPAVSAAVRLAS